MDSQRRRPPDYSSRKVQVRLFVLVSMFMLVLLAMEKVRDPRMWGWLWRNEPWAQGSPETNDARPDPLSALTQPAVDTQLPLQPQMGATSPDEISTSRDPLVVPEEGAPQQRVDDDLWARLLQSLDQPQQFLFDRVLYVHRHAKSLADVDQSDSLATGRRGPSLDRSAWPAVVEQLAERADSYFTGAQRATEHSTLGEQQQTAWLALLQERRKQWDEVTLPTLQAIGEKSLSEEQRQRLESIQSSLDRLAFANIRDNSVHLPVEARAWFRHFELLRDMPPEQLTPEATERVGFLQLFRQPEVYRGKLVTIHGVVERAYRLKAPANAFDIDGYTILWLRPTGGPSSPVVIYTLNLPAGFPEVVDRDQPGQSTAHTKLLEEIDVTGYYFKNWAYLSEGGINTAPLMLANMPRWTPAKAPVSKRPMHPLELTAWIASMGILALLLATLAYYSSNRNSRGLSEERAPDHLAQFELLTPAERLRRMSEAEAEETE